MRKSFPCWRGDFLRISCFKYANNFSPTVSFQWVIARSPKFFQGFHESMSVIPEMFLY